MSEEEEDPRTYSVVVNHEEQYSIWLADRPIPAGWREEGTKGLKAHCLAHIGEIWTDMRPLSLRRKLAEWEAERAKEPAPEPEAEPTEPEDPVNDLVRRLSVAQPIEAGLRPDRTARRLQEAIGRGYVHMKFVRTGTELGIRLEEASCDFAGADFERGTGKIRIVGTLTLNYNKVRYHGDLDVATLAGEGRLEFLEAVRPGHAAAS